MVIELTKEKFNEFIKKGVVLIDFHAHWCMHCVMMSPIVDEISKKFRGKINPDFACRRQYSGTVLVLMLKVSL